MLKHLKHSMSEAQRQAALVPRNYGAYCSAAENGHINVLQYLECKMTDEQKRAAIISLYTDECTVSQASRNLLTMKHLLHKVEFFAWALMHRKKYERHLHSFSTEKVIAWQLQSQAFLKINPDGVFDLDETDACLALCIANYLIQLRTPKTTERARFLMNIPSVAARAHETIALSEKPYARSATTAGFFAKTNNNKIAISSTIPNNTC